MNYTQGPWVVEKRELDTDAGDEGRPGSHGSQTHLIWTANDPNDTSVVAHIVVDGEIGKSEADGNARLISLAPELFAIVAQMGYDSRYSPELRNLLKGTGVTELHNR
jgi:hypothetical protein